MPYVKLGLSVLKVACKAGALASGLPIGNVGEWVGQQLGALDELRAEAVSHLGEPIVDEVDACCAQAQEGVAGEAAQLGGSGASGLGQRLKQPLETSLRELEAMLGKSYPRWREQCGLVQAECESDGSVEWVLAGDAEEFRRRGRAMLDDAAAAGPSASAGDGNVPEVHVEAVELRRKGIGDGCCEMM